jgi:hypothetical protein
VNAKPERAVCVCTGGNSTDSMGTLVTDDNNWSGFFPYEVIPKQNAMPILFKVCRNFCK